MIVTLILRLAFIVNISTDQIMKSIKERLGKMTSGFDFKKEHFVPFIISVALVTIVFVNSSYFHGNLIGILWIVIGIFFSLVLLAIMVMAGFTVIKSLFRISAGLSLLIFLAQSYCAVPHNIASNRALITLLGIGFLYMTFDFVNSLHHAFIKEIMPTIKNVDEREFSWQKKALFALLFILFAGFFVYGIYQVISPIILDLCVYKG